MMSKAVKIPLYVAAAILLAVLLIEAAVWWGALPIITELLQILLIALALLSALIAGLIAAIGTLVRRLRAS